MKKVIIVLFVLLLVGGAGYSAYTLGFKRLNQSVDTSEISVPTETMVGSDKDEHGCIGSAGYTWCETKQKCLREWEEACDELGDESVNKDVIADAIREQVIAKHGSDAAKLNITVAKVSGDYAQGGASGEGGGGMWFAAKVNGLWKLVWDGNGIITCDSIANFPDFPSEMIPECFNEKTDKMIIR
jgi:hypothetical protein